MSKAQENAAFPGYTMDMDTKRVSFQEGMALRDYFAAKVLQGLCSHDPLKITPENVEAHAKIAYHMADAMLKVRER